VSDLCRLRPQPFWCCCCAYAVLPISGRQSLLQQPSACPVSEALLRRILLESLLLPQGDGLMIRQTAPHVILINKLRFPENLQPELMRAWRQNTDCYLANTTVSVDHTVCWKHCSVLCRMALPQFCGYLCIGPSPMAILEKLETYPLDNVAYDNYSGVSGGAWESWSPRIWACSRVAPQLFIHWAYNVPHTTGIVAPLHKPCKLTTVKLFQCSLHTPWVFPPTLMLARPKIARHTFWVL